MSEQHILTAFDRDLEAIQALIMKMGGQVESAIREAAKALEEGDIELAEKVRAADKAIDRLDEQVREETARVLALRSPTAGDLRAVLTVMSISLHLERVGDYAKNMAKRTLVLAEFDQIENTYASLRRMAGFVEAMVTDALDAYVQRDDAKARDVIERDEEADQMYNTLFRTLLTYMMEDPRHITACMHMHFIAKNIERMGDHATAIAEQGIYLVTGEHPDESRAKADKTSTEQVELGG